MPPLAEKPVLAAFLLGDGVSRRLIEFAPGIAMFRCKCKHRLSLCGDTAGRAKSNCFVMLSGALESASPVIGQSRSRSSPSSLTISVPG